jgi:hypothetical protein
VSGKQDGNSGAMMGADDGFSEIPQWQTKTYRHRLARASCQSPKDMVKWASVRSKQLLEIKGIRCTYSKGLMIKVTHTMIPGPITSWSKNHL